MAKKGLRKLVFEVNGRQINSADIEKTLYAELKNNDVVFGDDIEYYINMNEMKAYCVITSKDTFATRTIEINI